MSGHPLRIALLSLGCKVNQAEISEMEQAFISGGHIIVGLDDSPDYCIINTCTVTSKSDYQSRQLIRRAVRSGGKVIATGCYTEMSPEQARAISENVTLRSNAEKQSIPVHLDSSLTAARHHLDKASRSRHFLKIQDGCDNQCTYCRIWMARGRSRSLQLEEVVKRAQMSEEAGCNEIVLTGIHLGLYSDQGVNLGTLLRRLLEETSKVRYRISSMEYNEVDDVLLELISTSHRVCRHLHIPLQSGDDGVLAGMGRRYNTKDFKDKLLRIQRNAPGVNIGTDLIAGFPSETIKMHENTVSYIWELPLGYMHVFPYSKRDGTKAAIIKDLVGDSERKRRADELREIGKQMKLSHINKTIGTNQEVLIEERIDHNIWSGLSGNYLRVQVSIEPDYSEKPRGELFSVNIFGSNAATALGTLIKPFN